MVILGFIPARSGSKGIKSKNLAPLLGRPLIEYTFLAALESQSLTRTIVSTDDPEIASLAIRFGVEAPFMRPSELAGDETPMLPVILHGLNWLKETEGHIPDAVVLLQPTSPLRQGTHIDSAVDLLVSTGADTVVSVVPVPHQFNPVSLMREEEGLLLPYQEAPMILDRHLKPVLFARNGPAVLVVRSQVLEAGMLYGPQTRPLEMTWAESVDVDDSDDLSLAAFRLETRGNKQPH